MVCSRRFWTAPSEERWVDTFWIAAAIVSIALSALVLLVPSTFSPSMPRLFAPMDSISTEILFSSVESAPTCRLKVNASEVSTAALRAMFRVITVSEYVTWVPAPVGFATSVKAVVPSAVPTVPSAAVFLSAFNSVVSVVTSASPSVTCVLAPPVVSTFHFWLVLVAVISTDTL